MASVVKEALMVYTVNNEIDSYATIVILIRAAVKKKRMNCVIPSNLIESDFDYFVTIGGLDYSVTKEGDVIISWETPRDNNSVAKYLYKQVMEEVMDMDLLGRVIQDAVYAIDFCHNKNEVDLQYRVTSSLEPSDIHYLVTWFNIETIVTVNGYQKTDDEWIIDFSWR